MFVDIMLAIVNNISSCIQMSIDIVWHEASFTTHPPIDCLIIVYIVAMAKFTSLTNNCDSIKWNQRASHSIHVHISSSNYHRLHNFIFHPSFLSSLFVCFGSEYVEIEPKYYCSWNFSMHFKNIRQRYVHCECVSVEKALIFIQQLFFFSDALRTQPYDLLSWSAAYFRCIANNVQPPAKFRYEENTEEMIATRPLTKEYLKVLVKQVIFFFNFNTRIFCLSSVNWIMRVIHLDCSLCVSDWKRIFYRSSSTRNEMERYWTVWGICSD